MTDRGRAGDDEPEDADAATDDERPTDDPDRPGPATDEESTDPSNDEAATGTGDGPEAVDEASATATGGEPSTANTNDEPSTATTDDHPSAANANDRRADGDAPRDPDERPTPQRVDDPVPAPSEHPIRWYLNSRQTLVVVSRDVLSSLAVVAVIGLILFAISGVWPPLVAVESGSMEPNMQQGDLVLLVDTDRYTSDEATLDGIVTREIGAETGHESFDEPGSVIIFRPDGNIGQTPIIHRAEFHVEEGENWFDRADERHLDGYESCDQLPDSACPAPHDGYVTKGDANGGYDQVRMQSTVVEPDWVEGRAVLRVPYLGCVRLALTDAPNCW